MLVVTIPEREWFNNDTAEFQYVRAQTITLEHSLLSVSKWESKWKKSFFRKQAKTFEEQMDYYRCMTITPNVDPLVYGCFTPKIMKEINDYMEDRQSATYFHESNQEGRSPGYRRTITSEIIYGWMIECGVPFQCEKWHLNRLMNLIHICQQNMNPKKGKMSTAEIMRRNSSLNAARRARMGSRG